MLFCFVYIQEIPNLNEIKFIRSILFPWNKNFDAESIIKIWNEFWETKKFGFLGVVLIWDDMKNSEMMKIFLTVSENNTNLKIHIKWSECDWEDKKLYIILSVKVNPKKWNPVSLFLNLVLMKILIVFFSSSSIRFESWYTTKTEKSALYFLSYFLEVPNFEEFWANDSHVPWKI